MAIKLDTKDTAVKAERRFKNQEAEREGKEQSLFVDPLESMAYFEERNIYTSFLRSWLACNKHKTNMMEW